MKIKKNLLYNQIIAIVVFLFCTNKPSIVLPIGVDCLIVRPIYRPRLQLWSLFLTSSVPRKLIM